MSTIQWATIPGDFMVAENQTVTANSTATGFVATTVGATKRQETYLGTTGASGYTVTYATAFSATPDVQPQIQSASATDTTSVRITASSTTGFTVVVRNRTDVIGLLPTYANVSSASVSVLVTER